VRGDVCGHGPGHRPALSGGGRLHARRARGRRLVAHHRPPGSRLARGLRGRLRLGRLRAHTGTGGAGRRGLHRCARAAGRGGRRGRAAAATAEDRTLVAWAEVQEALAAAGVGRQSGETNVEYARRAAPAVHLNGLLTGLAADATAATFAGDGVSDELAERAEL